MGGVKGQEGGRGEREREVVVKVRGRKLRCDQKPSLIFSLSDYLFKLLLIGDSGVGKSCLLLRFAVSERQLPHCSVPRCQYVSWWLAC